jgi:hypothetical protein
MRRVCLDGQRVSLSNRTDPDRRHVEKLIFLKDCWPNSVPTYQVEDEEGRTLY